MNPLQLLCQLEPKFTEMVFYKVPYKKVLLYSDGIKIFHTVFKVYHVKTRSFLYTFKKSLKISKEYSEAACRRTDNAMAKKNK
jgi:hypothetical protein